MFYKSKRHGIPAHDWKKAWLALNERFAKKSESVNIPDLYRFGLSPIQAFKVIYHLDISIRKNSNRIFKMQGFGSRLIEAMTDNKISQLSLSQIIGLTQPQIHYYRKGHSTPRPIVRQKLATTLSVDYLWLSWGAGEKRYYSWEEYPKEQLHLSLGERITFAMMINGTNVEALSRKLRMSGSGLQYWMEGKRKPSNSLIKNLAKELKVEYDWLRHYKS